MFTRSQRDGDNCHPNSWPSTTSLTRQPITSDDQMWSTAYTMGLCPFNGIEINVGAGASGITAFS